ncbi:MAG: outer membrane protein assembly factor BamD [Chlamydia sp.]
MKYLRISNIKTACSLLVFSLYILCSNEIQAGYIYKNNRLYNEKYAATNACEEHFNSGLKKLENRELRDSELEFKTVIESFPETSYALEALYYLGIIKFEENSLDIANRYLSAYLEQKNSPEHYEDLFRYKLAIAKRLASGEKRHLFGYEALPKIMTGYQIAQKIFNEIIKALPHQEIGAQAMIEKGDLHASREEFLEAVESYQEAIHKFPKSTFAITGFTSISTAYLKQIECEPQNNDILALAEINLREMQKMFPNSTQVSTIETNIGQMREIFAAALYDIGQLYERMKRPKAALICYTTILQKYPSTKASDRSKKEIELLQPSLGSKNAV